MMVRNRDVDPIAVERRAPLHAALVAAGTDQGAPDEVSSLRIEERGAATLRANTDDRAPVSVESQPHDVHPRAAEVPFLAVRLGSAPGHGERETAARLQPRTVALHSVRPPRGARLQVEGDDGLQERPWLLARFG